jgi:hypothetical protein
VQAKPPPEGAASAAAENEGELKTENCFTTLLPSHFGQMIFSLADMTMVSKWCAQL